VHADLNILRGLVKGSPKWYPYNMQTKHPTSRREQNIEKVLRLERALEEIWESTRVGLGFLSGEKRLFRRRPPEKRKPSRTLVKFGGTR
jgi:hypothetical protein